MRPIRRLIFNGWIPPRVHMNHIIRCGQIEASSTRFERNQEGRRVSILKLVDLVLPSCRRCRAIEILIRNSLGVHHFANNREMLYELTKDQNTVPLLSQLQESLGELCQFC